MADDLSVIGFKANTKGIKDINNALKGMAKQGDATEDSLDGNTTKISSGFSKAASGATLLATGVVKVAGVAVTAGTALAALANSIGNNVQEMQAMARESNTTIADMQRMSFVYEQFGLNVDQVTSIFKDSTERIGDWLNNGSGAFEDFGNAMGMSSDELTTYAKSVQNLSGQQLLQKMINDMESTGVSSRQMQNALESMASEATRMIPALSNNGEAARELAGLYDELNSALQLDDTEIQQWSKMAGQFDLFMSTGYNALIKVVTPLAEEMGDLAEAAARFISAIANPEGLQGQLKLIGDINDEIGTLQKRISTNESYASGFSPTSPIVASAEAQNAAWQSQIEQLEAQRAEVEKRVEELKNELKSDDSSSGSDGTPTGTGTNPLMESYQKQLTSLENQMANVWLQGDALFINQQVQQAKAAGYSDEMVQSIKDQAISYLSAKNEAEEYFASVEQGKTDFEKLVTSQDDVSESIDWLNEIEGYQTYADSIRSEIDRVNAAIQSGKFDDNSGPTAYLSELEEQLDSIDNKVASTFGSMSSWAGVISGIAEDGSSAEKDINNIATGLSAAASFASGDYLSAATSTISLLDSLGDIGDAYEADEIQAEQFLDKWDNKLDSIDTSTETAANATEDLVMINTDMLDALQDLSEAIASAASLITGDVDTDLIDNSSLFDDNPLSGVTYTLRDMFSTADWLGLDDALFDGLFSSILGSGLDLIGGLLGGSSSTVDSGIRVIGGYISDLTDDVLVQAYETVKYKKYAWSSSSKKTGYETLDDEISNQFSLVFEGIIDSVGEASSILGLSSDEISDAISDFYVDTTKISLDGLDDDEAADEITAYFSDVFNDLAEAVVPYLEDFQDAGEELGDTLTRLATEVSTLEVLFDLGVAFGDLYDASYDLTAAADNIATMLGGDDAFSEAVSSFLSNFASDADMMELYGDTLTESLGDVGLSLSDSADEFYELFKSLDASTEAGQEQIATMLELESTAAAYYDLLESVTDSFDDLKDSIWDDDTDDAVTSISQALQDAMRGDFTATEDLLENGVTLDSSDYATAAEYAIAQATASSQLDQLEALYTGQTKIDEQQLDYLEQIANNTADSSSVTSTSEDSTALQSIANDSATQAAKLSTMNKSISDLNDTVERISNIVGA
jgi:hypothetical protein